MFTIRRIIGSPSQSILSFITIPMYLTQRSLELRDVTSIEHTRHHQKKEKKTICSFTPEIRRIIHCVRNALNPLTDVDKKLHRICPDLIQMLVKHSHSNISPYTLQN